MADAHLTTLRRGIAILFTLGSDEAQRNGGLGVVRVADLLGRDKSQVSRTLKALAQCDVVERDPETQLYRLSWQLFSLAAQAGEQRLLAAAPDLLARLVGQLGESAHLSVLRRSEVLTVLTEPSANVVQAAGWIGRTLPSVCTSSGRALLFDHDLDQLTALFSADDFARLGPRAPRDVAELSERIAAARERGYAVVDEEFEPGLVAVAAPVRDVRGAIIAALNVSGPKFRFTRLATAGQLIRAAAADLTQRLGGGSAPIDDVLEATAR